jgi:hypothetical protein
MLQTDCPCPRFRGEAGTPAGKRMKSFAGRPIFSRRLPRRTGMPVPENGSECRLAVLRQFFVCGLRFAPPAGPFESLCCSIIVGTPKGGFDFRRFFLARASPFGSSLRSGGAPSPEAEGDRDKAPVEPWIDGGTVHRTVPCGLRFAPPAGPFESLCCSIIVGMPKGGFEPPRVSPPPPQDGVSANSTTSARCSFFTTLNPESSDSRRSLGTDCSRGR